MNTNTDGVSAMSAEFDGSFTGETMKQEQAVTMAAKLYECRDTARRLFGEGYKARMDSYGKVIRSIAKTTGTSELSAAISAAKKVEGMASICFLAAAVEMTEPSNTEGQRP